MPVQRSTTWGLNCPPPVRNPCRTDEVAYRTVALLSPYITVTQRFRYYWLAEAVFPLLSRPFTPVIRPRARPGALHFNCDVNIDPFIHMHENNMVLFPLCIFCRKRLNRNSEFLITLYESSRIIASLWSGPMCEESYTRPLPLVPLPSPR